MLDLKLKQPKKRYLNVEEARKKESLWRNAEDKKYPCIKCNGRGNVIAPGEQCDPCEGYKFALRIACPSCKGKGIWPKKKFLEWYSKSVNLPYLTDVSIYKKRKAILDKLKKKLTKADFEALFKAYKDTYGS